jgi:predicted regulator of Ras-like GTPase activity (Roadblock/LC7/MglB family)
MASSFSLILESAVNRTPGAIGGAFAASDGELVDSYARLDADEWALLTAHYGVVLGHMQAALRTFHYGEAEVVLLTHDRLDILVHAVGEGYYALIALRHPAQLARALAELGAAADDLRREMG